MRGLGAHVTRSSDGRSRVDIDDNAVPHWVINGPFDRQQFETLNASSSDAPCVTERSNDSLDNIRYVQVSAGYSHTVVLRSDGAAFAFGANTSGQCDLPTEPEFVQVSAGCKHTVLLHKDGHVVAIGSNEFHQCDVPQTSQGSPRIAQISAGRRHTAILQADGQAFAVGCNEFGQCNIPAVSRGVTYLQVSAGGHHTALLRSDGQVAVAGHFCGITIPSVLEHQTWGEYAMTKPCLPPAVKYIADFGELPVQFVSGYGTVVVQLSAKVTGSRCKIRGLTVSGDVMLEDEVPVEIDAEEARQFLSEKLSIERWRLQVVLPSGRLLSEFGRHSRFVDAMEACGR